MEVLPFLLSIALALCLIGLPVCSLCVLAWCVMFVCVRLMMAISSEEEPNSAE